MEQGLILKEYEERRSSIGVSIETSIVLAIAISNPKGQSPKNPISKWCSRSTEEPTIHSQFTRCCCENRRRILYETSAKWLAKKVKGDAPIGRQGEQWAI